MAKPFLTIFIFLICAACSSQHILSFKALNGQEISEDGSEVKGEKPTPITLKVNNPFPSNNSLYRFIITIKNNSKERTILELKNIVTSEEACRVLTSFEARNLINNWKDIEVERAQIREKRLIFGTYAQYEADYTPGLFDGDIEYAPQANLDVEILQSQTRKKIDKMETIAKAALSEVEESYLNTLFLAPGDSESRVFYVELMNDKEEKEIKISIKTTSDINDFMVVRDTN